MPDIYATNDGNINFNQGAAFGWTWDSVQQHTTGTVNSSQTNSMYGVRGIQFNYLGNDRYIIITSVNIFSSI